MDEENWWEKWGHLVVFVGVGDAFCHFILAIYEKILLKLLQTF